MKGYLLASVAGMAMACLSAPAIADVSIMYPEWMSALVEPGIANFAAETGQKVNAVKMPGDGYEQRVAVDLAAGTAPDVVVVDSFMVSELASSGYLYDLDDKLAGWDQFKAYMPGLLDVASYDGSVYALPTDTDVRMLWYDKSVFEKAGIALPWAPKTWDDVLQAAAKVKASGVENAFVLPAGTKQGEAATMQGFYMALLGADAPTDDRNRLRAWDKNAWIGDSPALRRTLDLYRQVYVDQKLTPASINYETDVAAAIREAISKDQLGILASGSWEFSCLWDCNGVNIPSAEERNATLGWTPWPGSGAPGAPETTNISGGWTIGMSSKAADPDAAFGLLTAIFDQKNFSQWTVGEHRMGVRTDITESAEYTSDAFLAEATKLAATTTGRDTFPGYAVVTTAVQEATAAILDGASVEEAIAEYKATLEDEFGPEAVITIE